MTVLLNPVYEWTCPACKASYRTKRVLSNRFHNCAKMKGLTTPMVPAGTKAKLTAHEREDYIGGDIVRLNDEGRPVMSIVTTRDDGEDATVFAPTATAFGRN
jgi:hypothetical protein